jgi:hypothetical protein
MAGVIQGCFPHGIARIGASPAPARSAPLQRKTANGNAVQLQPHIVMPTVGGQPLAAPVLQLMESAFGARFGDVRIHIGPHAANLGAIAFTRGSNIHFAPGRYDPSSAPGRQLLAHELAHVVQQRTGRVQNPFGSGVAVVHDAALEAEAERLAQRAAAQRVVAPPIQPMRRSSRTPAPRNLFQAGSSGMEPALPYASHAVLTRDVADFDDGLDEGRPFHAGMRLSAAGYAAAYGAYHAADLVSLGLLSDVSWYRGAVNRGNPAERMGVGRAAIGLAGTVAWKGAAAAGAASVSGVAALGAGAVAVGSGLATRAGRWAYDWVDWAVTGVGENVVTTNFEHYVRGETMKSTGMKLIGAEGTRGNANTTMGMSASVRAGRPPKADASSRHHYEWLHLLGRSLGGEMDPANFVAGSYHANTEMIPLENVIRQAANDVNTKMQVCITAFCVAGTDIANRINYKVYKNDRKVFEKTFDANRGPVSAAENAVLREAASAAILNEGLWGSLRRWVGPR